MSVSTDTLRNFAAISVLSHAEERAPICQSDIHNSKAGYCPELLFWFKRW